MHERVGDAGEGEAELVGAVRLAVEIADGAGDAFALRNKWSERARERRAQPFSDAHRVGSDPGRLGRRRGGDERDRTGDAGGREPARRGEETKPCGLARGEAPRAAAGVEALGLVEPAEGLRLEVAVDAARETEIGVASMDRRGALLDRAERRRVPLWQADHGVDAIAPECLLFKRFGDDCLEPVGPTRPRFGQADEDAEPGLAIAGTDERRERLLRGVRRQRDEARPTVHVEGEPVGARDGHAPIASVDEERMQAGVADPRADRGRRRRKRAPQRRPGPGADDSDRPLLGGAHFDATSSTTVHFSF